MTKKEVYDYYYGSDIFNVSPNNIRNEPNETVKFRKIHKKTENTKEDVFNIGNQKRIKRGITKNTEINNKSVGRKHGYNTESDIFFYKNSNSCEKRKGVKFIPSILNKSTFLYENRNVDEFNKDLKEYQILHRDNNKNSYNPDKYINRMSTNERYFKAYYDDNIFNADNENKKSEQLKKYIHDKKYLKSELTKINDDIADINKNKNLYKRYTIPKRNNSEEKRFFVDSTKFPKYNCKINKQLQMESNIFNTNEMKENDIFLEAKEIYNRLEKAKKNYIKNNRRYNPNNLNTKKNKNALNIPNQRNNKFSENLQYSNNTIAYTGKMKDIYLLNNSNNYDLITGREINKVAQTKNKKKEKSDNTTIQEAIESIPNLSERNKLQLRNKTAVLELNNDKDLAKKRKELIEYYKTNSNKIKKNDYITRKIGEKNNIIINTDDEFNKMPSEKYIMTYTSNDQLDKFDSNELKQFFDKKGVHAYDIKKINKGRLKNISFKVNGQDDAKINSVENELKKDNCKFKIKKDEKLKNGNNEKNKNITEEKRFKIMPKEILQRKGFSKQLKK